MNEPHDPLEAELAALQPREPSHETRRRIGDRLTPTSPARSARWWAVPVTVGVVAAVLMMAIFLKRGNDASTDAKLSALASRPALPNAFDDALPSLRVYRHALNQSPEKLDALLAQHAVLASNGNPHSARIRVLIGSDAEYLSSIGEL